MTHADLCIATATRFVKDGRLALYEYKSTASAEEPDVLVFNTNGTVLYEIKMSRADFLADRKKECRKKYILPYGVEYARKKNEQEYLKFHRYHPEEFLKQAPHLGNERYFVCPHGMIQTEELYEGWGLCWYKDGKFYCKKTSAKFRSDLRRENNLLTHGFRRFASGDHTGILVNTY
jgi:hypothetical protein